MAFPPSDHTPPHPPCPQEGTTALIPARAPRLWSPRPVRCLTIRPPSNRCLLRHCTYSSCNSIPFGCVPPLLPLTPSFPPTFFPHTRRRPHPGIPTPKPRCSRPSLAYPRTCRSSLRFSEGLPVSRAPASCAFRGRSAAAAVPAPRPRPQRPYASHRPSTSWPPPPHAPAAWNCLVTTISMARFQCRCAVMRSGLTKARPPRENPRFRPFPTASLACRTSP